MSEHSFLFEQVLSNWYDRDESDAEIIAEMIQLGGSAYTTQAVAAIHRFLADPTPSDVKSHQIRNAIWRVLPDDETATLTWLAEIAQALNRE